MSISKQLILEASGIAFRLWFFTSLVLGAAWFLYGFTGKDILSWYCIIVTTVALIVSLPILLALVAIIPLIHTIKVSSKIKILLLILFCIICCAIYAAIGVSPNSFNISNKELTKWAISTGVLSASSLIAILILKKQLIEFFTTTYSSTLN